MVNKNVEQAEAHLRWVVDKVLHERPVIDIPTRMLVESIVDEFVTTDLTDIRLYGMLGVVVELIMRKAEAQET